MRRPLIAANWKLQKTIAEARTFTRALLKGLGDDELVDVAIAPPFTALSGVAELLRGTRVLLAAQNVFWEEKGAFTGEVAAGMLKEAGCDMVIVGHSERRQYFHETDGTVNRRTVAALSHGLSPIICIGETLEERDRNETFEVVRTQLDGALSGIDETGAERSVIAYEPVWAIGTGRTATPEQAQEVHQFIRNRLAEVYNRSLADGLRILYGGSMKPTNAAGLIGQPDIDGGLVGGASLEVESFLDIIRAPRS
jgi:triosephosphate isomerase